MTEWEFSPPLTSLATTEHVGVDLSDSNVTALWAAAEAHTDDTAEQAYLVALCIATGRKASWLHKLAQVRCEQFDGPCPPGIRMPERWTA